MWEMKRNVSVVRFKFRCNILISGKIIKEMPGSVASGTHCSSYLPAYEDGTECSEKSACKIQTPGNCPEGSIQDLLFYDILHSSYLPFFHCVPCVCCHSSHTLCCISHFCWSLCHVLHHPNGFLFNMFIQRMLLLSTHAMCPFYYYYYYSVALQSL